MRFNYEIPSDNYLKPNGHGGYVVSASALQSWSRCNLATYYSYRAKADENAPQPAYLSATTFGSVMHYIFLAMEQEVHEGRTDALERALRNLEYYWHPANLSQLGLQITEWLPRQTHGGLLERGKLMLRDYYEAQRKSDAKLLALEYPFAVPLEVNGRLHTLHGFVDRLQIAKYKTKPVVELVDYKSGKRHYNLRWHTQGTFYAFVSTLPEFWTGWEGSGVGELAHFDDDTIGRIESSFEKWGYALHRGSAAIGDGLPLAARRFQWVSLQDSMFADGGWRTERDYSRLAMAVDAYVRANEAGAYSVNQSGEICARCEWRHICGGIGVPDENDGRPL